MRKGLGVFIFIWLFLSLASGARAAERIQFKSGSNSGTVSGSVKGYDMASYLFGAKAGQAVTIRLSSKNRFLYFNLVDPATSNTVPGAPSPGTVTEWSGTLPKSGDYQIDVFLMRNEARRGKTAPFTLDLTIK